MRRAEEGSECGIGSVHGRNATSRPGEKQGSDQTRFAVVCAVLRRLKAARHRPGDESCMAHHMASAHPS